MFGKPFAWSRGISTFCLWICGAITLAGCVTESSDIGTIEVNRSIEGTVTGIVGKPQSFHLTFTAIGAASLANFTISAGLIALPLGWSGPTTFSCVSVDTSAACKLDLVFTPTSAGSGTLTFGYSYQGTSGKALNGSVSVDYGAVAANTVMTTVSPSGQVNAIVGTGTRSVSVTFNTNDNASTALVVTTNLLQLPSGWSAASNTFSCSEVNSGNGCQLQLSYAPTVVGSGALVVNYQYTDNAGIARTASVGINYSATSHNNLAATISPSGQIIAVSGGSQAVQVAFTTDDGNAVSNVAITSNLTGLTSGWSSATPTFTCATASTGNSCQLSLTYAPIATGSGTLTLNYGYNDNAGTAQVGHINIPYIATANNNVIGSVSPSGQIVTAVGATSPATVTFATDDANSASSLTVTTNLSSLPTGWSSSSPSLACSTVNSGTGCQLSLSFTPPSGVSGTLQINYSYTNNAGTPKTGSVSIPYIGTTAHVYIGQLSSNIVVCEIGSNGLLGNCANSGIRGNAVALSGSRAYIADYGNSVIRVCDLALNGSLANCAITGSNYFSPFVITVSGNTLYAASANYSHMIMYCPIQSDGTIGVCAETTALNGGEGINTNNGYLYLGRPHDGAGTVYVCQQAVDGTLSACANTGSGFNQTQDIAISGNFAFVANTNDGTVSTCTINGSTGALSACSKSAVASGPMGVAIHNNRAYVSTRSGNVHVCDINGTTGALSNCVVSNGGSSLGLTVQIAIH